MRYVSLCQIVSKTYLPSQFKIGDEVLFKCFDNLGISCKVVGIKFDESKVLYDLAVFDPIHNNFYEVRPLQDVDSFFVVKKEIK